MLPPYGHCPFGGEGVKTLAQVVWGTFLSTSKWAISSSGGQNACQDGMGTKCHETDAIFIWSNPHIMRLTFDLDT